MPTFLQKLDRRELRGPATMRSLKSKVPVGYGVVAGVPEWPKGSDCKSDAQASVVRIHPPAPYI